VSKRSHPTVPRTPSRCWLATGSEQSGPGSYFPATPVLGPGEQRRRERAPAAAHASREDRFFGSRTVQRVRRPRRRIPSEIAREVDVSSTTWITQRRRRRTLIVGPHDVPVHARMRAPNAAYVHALPSERVSLVPDHRARGQDQRGHRTNASTPSAPPPWRVPDLHLTNANEQPGQRGLNAASELGPTGDPSICSEPIAGPRMT
jgi:hypothetical protein